MGNRFRDKVFRFMQGRYGTDQFNKFLMAPVMIFLILSLFGLRFLYIPALLIMGYSYFRTFSRNIIKRQAENNKYLQVTYKIRCKWAKFKDRLSQMKDYRFFKCPKCGQKLRVPKGRGRIAISCRKCGTEFIKKT